jgi:hypothetical protein
MSTYEGEHTIFGLLGQANLTENYVLQFHPFTWVFNSVLNLVDDSVCGFYETDKESTD